MKPLNIVLSNLYKERNRFASNKELKNEQPENWKLGCLDIEEEIKAVEDAIETLEKLEVFKNALKEITK